MTVLAGLFVGIGAASGAGVVVAAAAVIGVVLAATGVGSGTCDALTEVLDEVRSPTALTRAVRRSVARASFVLGVGQFAVAAVVALLVGHVLVGFALMLVVIAVGDATTHQLRIESFEE